MVDNPPFFDSPHYNMMQSSGGNRLKPYEYFRLLFDKLPYAESEDDYKKLLPQFVDPALLAIP